MITEAENNAKVLDNLKALLRGAGPGDQSSGCRLALDA